MPQDGQPFSLSEVLAEELAGLGRSSPYWANPPTTGDSEPVRRLKETERRSQLYRTFYGHRLAALCLSGGGIRSAAVSLGVIQALVEGGLLRRFNYLSTVSGGGYIGSWLSAWLYHSRDEPTGSEYVLRQLRSDRQNAESEAASVAHLRKYSNYLTPERGLFSADTWTAIVIILRNILINWMILLPFLVLVVVACKFIALLLVTPRGEYSNVVSDLCLIFGGFSLGYKLYHLYCPDAVDKRSTAQLRFLIWSLFPALLAGLCFVWLALQRKTPADAVMRLWVEGRLPESWGPGLRSFLEMVIFALAIYAVALLVGAGRSVPLSLRATPQTLRDKPLSIEAISFHLHEVWFGLKSLPSNLFLTVFGRQRLFAIGGCDFLAWGAGIVVFATVVWLGAWIIHGLPPHIALIGKICAPASGACAVGAAGRPPTTVSSHALVVIFGVPGFLLATLLAHTIYLLLRSGSREGEVEREWLGRASGWHFIAAIAWIALAAIVLLGPELYANTKLLGEHAGKWLTGLTAATGAVTGFLGHSGLTPAEGKASGKAGISANVALAVAGPLFAVLVLILLSVGVDLYVQGRGQQCFPVEGKWDCSGRDLTELFAWAVLVLFVADFFANINAFSVHAIYRNRLVRAFLGGARARRHPDGFTDFDWDDDLRVASLWDRQEPPRGKDWRPFHVLNMTLNLSATSNLAWQERKAMPFTVSPLFCGNSDLGYRASDQYGGPAHSVTADLRPTPGGISLGTAMAISGAAVSSNMGYHSSRSLSFLLTFFNVRLGCWLGNPGEGGGWWPWFARWAPYRAEGPHLAMLPLLKELFGLTSGRSAYVYLSDGGHFEDFGLYEMVRRRCKWIVVCDGAEDANRGYEDLGNAVRKIWIDLGVQISFPDSALLRALRGDPPAGIPYFAVGTVRYLSDLAANGTVPEGKLLYIKPVVRGDEAAADVIAYQRAHPEFPQQSTANQWFDESQLEAYRRLGYLMTERIIKAAAGGQDRCAGFTELFKELAAIDPKTMAKPLPEPDT
jgi:Patatin-like phospholipase